MRFACVVGLLKCFVGMPCKSLSCRLHGLNGNLPIWQTFQWAEVDGQISVNYLPVRTGASTNLIGTFPWVAFVDHLF